MCGDAAGAVGVCRHVLHLDELALGEVPRREAVVADGVERPQGVVVPIEAPQQRLTDRKAPEVHPRLQDARVSRKAVGEVCLPVEVVDGDGSACGRLQIRHGAHRGIPPLPRLVDVPAYDGHAAEGRQGADVDAAAREVPAGAARERLHAAAVLGQPVILVYVPRAGRVDRRVLHAVEEHQHVGAVETLVVGIVQLELREPVRAGVVGVIPVGRVEVALHGERLGLALVRPHLERHRLPFRKLEEPLPGATVQHALGGGEHPVGLGHLGGVLEREAVRQDLRPCVELVAGVDALGAVAASVVHAVLVRELTLAAVAHLIPARVREDRVLRDRLAAVDALGQVYHLVRVLAVEGGAGDDAHGPPTVVPEEQQSKHLCEADKVVHRGLARREDVVQARLRVAVLGRYHGQGPPCGAVVGVVVGEEGVVEGDGEPAVVARVADGGDERLDGDHRTLEVPAQVAHLPFRVRVAEVHQRAVQSGLVAVLVAALAVLVHAYRHIRPLVVHEGVRGIEIVREAVVGRGEVDDVPEGVGGAVLRQVVPCVLDGVGCDRRDAEVSDVVSVAVRVDEVAQGARRAVVLVCQGIEEAAEAAVEGDGVGVAAVVGVHRVEAAVAGLQDGAVRIEQRERRLACRVELRAVVADAENRPAVQAERSAEHAVVPARSGELHLVAGGVLQGGGVGHILADPVVENPRIVAEVHALPGDVELDLASHRRMMFCASSQVTA